MLLEQWKYYCVNFDHEFSGSDSLNQHEKVCIYTPDSVAKHLPSAVPSVVIKETVTVLSRVGGDISATHTSVGAVSPSTTLY